MITTKGQLYQWDTGRLIEVYPVDNYKVDEIHVFNGTTKFAPVLETWIDEKNGRTYAKIPDVLLQSDNNMDIYAVMSNDLGEHTQKHINVTVLRRAKPEDYVYTETELETWKKLEKRIEELEENSDTNNKDDIPEVDVTSESIKEALGYTPAKQMDVDKLQKAKVVVSNDEPTDGALWIDKDADEEVILAEIDDKKVSEEMTWSSQKINAMFTEYVDDIAELVGGDA